MACSLERLAESEIGGLFPGHAIMPGVGRHGEVHQMKGRCRRCSMRVSFDEESSRRHPVQANLTQAQRFSGRSGPAGYAWKRLAGGLLLTGMGDIWADMGRRDTGLQPL